MPKQIKRDSPNTNLKHTSVIIVIIELAIKSKDQIKRSNQKIKSKDQISNTFPSP
jgi:hypothetical protein